MKIILNKEQIFDLSNFSIDVAKGLMLAGILGQGFDFLISTVFTRVLVSASFVSLGLIFLLFGIKLKSSKKRRKKR